MKPLFPTPVKRIDPLQSRQACVGDGLLMYAIVLRVVVPRL